MVSKSSWEFYIDQINKGLYRIAFEHAKKFGRRVYVIDPRNTYVVASCSYQAFRKYRKYLHLAPGDECSRLH